MLDRPGLKAQILLDLARHPHQRHKGECGFRIATTDVRMHAGEPYLLDLLRILQVALIESKGMEGGAFVVERKRMTGAIDLVGKPVVTERNRPDGPVDGSAQFLDR